MNALIPAAVEGVTLADIAEALGVTKRSVERRAINEAWPFVEVAVIGGKKRFYPLERLPKAVCEDCQRLLVKRSIGACTLPATANLPAVAQPKPVALRAPITRESADAEQLVVQEARLSIISFIQKAVVQSRISESKSIDYWFAALADGSLPPQQRLWCALANNKNGFRWSVSFTTGRPVARAFDGQDVDEFAAMLSKRTVQRWIRDRKAGGDEILIPGKRLKDMQVPAWAGDFLTVMQRPQKPTARTAFDEMAKQLEAKGWTAHRGNGLPKAMEYPDYGSVCRWYRNKFSQLDKQRGRNTGSAMNPHKFFHERSTDGMEPLQEVHSDGWATKFYAPHPISGKWVTGEVWHSHDVATRKAYVHERSIGLSENTTVILGSLYAVSVEDGEPLFWQTDNTGAVKNDRVEFDPAASLAARRSIEIVHNIPGNSQANGIAESFNKYLQERAKELATYKGPDMDSLTQKRIHKLTNKLVKAANAGDAMEFARIRAEAEKAGCGIVFNAWSEAVAWVIKVVREFNDMPHASLPKITDTSGKRRNMTPNERMEEYKAAGWVGRPLAGDELIDAFRVHEVRRVTRGCVSIMGQRYHHAELDHLNGEDVLAAYDIEDGSQVHIKTLTGVPLFTAKFYESRGYRMQSFIDIALEKRATQQIGRLEKKVEAIEAQRPGMVVEMSLKGISCGANLNPAIEATAVRVEETLEAEVLAIPTDQAEQARRRKINQMEDPSLIRHLAANPADWNDHLRRYLAERADTKKSVAWLLDEFNLWGELEKTEETNEEKKSERRVS